MGKPVKKFKLKRTMRGSSAAANRKAITINYPYIATDYDASMPTDIKEDKKESYESYANDVTSRYAVECARELNEEVDNARGNGRFEGKENATLRRAWEENYMRQQKIRNIGAHCEEKQHICENETIKVDKTHFTIYDNHPEENGCIAANDKNYAMCKKNPDIGGGYVNIKDYVAEVQKHDPYCIIDVVVPSNGNNSGSGLHRVTIAPTIDKNGNVVIDPKTNLPKMTVYSFNNASKTPLEKYGQTHGVCFNLHDYARHNLKEEYEKNPELTQQRIDEYIKESKNKFVVSRDKLTLPNIQNELPKLDDIQKAIQKAYFDNLTR